MDYTDYDEIAHHSGPERPESLDALDGVDRELRDPRARPPRTPRGRTASSSSPTTARAWAQTFLQRYGVTLQDVVRSLMGGKASVAAATAQIEDWGQLNTFLGEVSETKGVTGSLARAGHATSARAASRSSMGPDAGRSSRPPAPPPRRSKASGRQEAADGDGRGGAGRPHRRRRRQPGAHLLQRQRRAHDARGRSTTLYPDLVAGARQPSGHRRPHGAHGRPRPDRAWARRASTSSTTTASRARTRWRSTASSPSPPSERLDEHRARRRHRGRQPVRPRDGRDRRLRGAHRRARRPGRSADAALPALPVRLGAGPRAAHRCAHGLPAAAPLDGAAAGHALRAPRQRDRTRERRDVGCWRGARGATSARGRLIPRQGTAVIDDP